MRTLITGAAGNLGGHLARHLAERGYALRLMVHRTPVARLPGAEVCRADLADPATLRRACEGVGAIVHFAGVLFKPRPEAFLPRTNVRWARSLIDSALAEGVRKFILVSFPHVEGESTPDRPALGAYARMPDSAHARTRRAAEEALFRACEGRAMAPVALRLGMVYGRPILMLDVARWLARRRLLAVWRRPTWIHLISLPDFLEATRAAIDGPGVRGIYNVGDDAPMTLQEFFDVACRRWGAPRPWRFADTLFEPAGWTCETVASFLGTLAPLTRDFIRIGMASYAMDTSGMRELLPRLKYPTLRDGIDLL